MTDKALKELLDKQALQELVIRYCRAVDRADGELFLSCYHPDGYDEHGPYSGSPAEMLAKLKKTTMDPKNVTVQHSISNSIFEIQGDIAYGETYFQTRRPDADGELSMSTGRYVDKYERRGGEWRIAYRRCIMDYARKGANQKEFVQGSRDRSDPSYERT
jgi:ketosteroid isomerase-like protein